MLKILLGSAALVGLALPATAAIDVTLEAPGVVNTTQALQKVGVETFDSWATGTHTSVATDFGGSTDYTGTYTGSKILVSDQYGGADNIGNYVVALGTGASYTLQLDRHADYFGFWLSALSGGNHIAFYNGATELGSYDYAFFNGLMNASYLGKPGTGQTSTEKFGFFNFNFTEGQKFDRVEFWNTGSDGFESDNHTVGSAVPEPLTWTMLIAGFGLVGLGIRRSNARRQGLGVHS